MKKKITIKDIAKIANVSIGTVDRVIHNRGKVSEKALQKVNDALKELDYKPNPMARSLKNNIIFSIVLLIPDPEKDSYWLPCQQGISEIISEFDAFDVDFSVNYFDPSDSDYFSQRGRELIHKNPDAFLFVPLFELESDDLLLQLNEKGILTGTFNSLPRNHVDHHVGQDLYLSGRVAAKLISDYLRPDSKIGIVHIDESINNAIHMQQKEKGFRSFFQNRGQAIEIVTQTLETGTMTKSLLDLVEINGIDAFFVTTSKTFEVARTLDNLNKKGIVVGYDLLPENIDCLIHGKIQFLIHQAPRLQAALSLKSLVEKLLFKKDIPEKLLLPIEIINSENVKSYR